MENSARKGDGRDGGSLRFLNPCCDQVLFAVAVPTVVDRMIQQAIAQELTPVYMEDGGFHATPEGVPQGGLCGAPHKFPYADTFIMLSQ